MISVETIWTELFDINFPYIKTGTLLLIMFSMKYAISASSQPDEMHSNLPHAMVLPNYTRNREKKVEPYFYSNYRFIDV